MNEEIFWKKELRFWRIITSVVRNDWTNKVMKDKVSFLFERTTNMIFITIHVGNFFFNFDIDRSK